ncbi:hypothetical protein N9L77_06350, partial [Pseudomonadales bacterium]|nr:hypothetical protein [Pseudomonadales bacterium]
FDAGFRIQKFFPAEALGGTRFLKSVSAPLPQLQFCATVGFTRETWRSIWRCHLCWPSAARGWYPPV